MTHSETLFETVYSAPRRTVSERPAPARPAPEATKTPMKRAMAMLTAGVTAMSLMVASAAPAHADRASDNLAKAVVAAIALGVIVNSIDKGRAQPAPAPVPAPEPVRYRSVVPSVCAIEVNGSRRDVVFYPERCLRDEGFDARLPRDCAIKVRIRGRVDRAYGEQCLRDAGFRIGGSGRDRDWRRDDRRDDRRGDRRDDRGGYGHGYGRGRDGYGY